MDTHFIDLSPILSKNKILNFVLGMSLGGKTYQALELAINTWRRYGARTVFCVRNEIQVSTDLLEGLLGEIDKIKTEKNWNLGETIINGSGVDASFSFGEGKPFLSFKSLHTIFSKKQVTIQNVKWLVFDEFVLNTRSGEKYMKDEITRFKWLFSKITRGYNYKTRAIFLGNTESAYNPYFAEYGIKPSFLKANTIVAPKNSEWAVELWVNKDRMKEISAKGLDKVLGGNYGKYAFGCSFLNDRTSLYLNKIPPKSKPVISFLCSEGKSITVWRNAKITLVKNETQSNIVCSCDNLDAVNGVIYAGLPSFKPIITALKEKADCGRLFFENAQAENCFFELYNDF